ncbi:MAG: ATP-binding protein [Deltaproteobacteria bacterium]|nr:ATP-binding protein [Deltaproteobacteria bacterium]
MRRPGSGRRCFSCALHGRHVLARVPGDTTMEPPQARRGGCGGASCGNVPSRLRRYIGVVCSSATRPGSALRAKVADLLFQVVAELHETRPLVLTGNLAISDWPTVSPNAACAVAIVDRVVHHANVLSIEGRSITAQ